VLGALAGIGALASSGAARADDAQAFELGKNPFDAGQYAEAHARLSALLNPELPPCDAGPSPAGRCHLASPELIERARALDAASLLALKRDVEADALIGAILRQNPSYTPSPAMFPQEVIDRFTMVRGTISAELRTILQQREREAEQQRLVVQQARDAEQKWIADLERLAARERTVEPNSRWIALVPFGIGQFQNGSVGLGILFATSEAAFGGASLVAVAIVNSLASTNISLRSPTNQPVDVPALNANIKTAVVVNQITFATWGAITLAGVIQAQVAFVPEKVTFHDRPIPPRPKLVPVAAPVPGGAILGLGGTF
jgi:hypothetical protein